MRIGFFTDFYLPRFDGVATSVEAYRAGLEELGHEVFVLCPKRPEPFQEPTNRIYRFPSVPSLWYEGYRDTFPFLPKHLKYITSLKFDVIHVFTQATVGLLGMYIAQKNNIPLVTTCNFDVNLSQEYRRMTLVAFISLITTSVASSHFLPKEKLKALLKPAPLNKWSQKVVDIATGYYSDQCDLTTVPSLKTKKALEPYTKKEVVIVPLPTDVSLAPHNPNIKSLRTKYTLPQNKILFISSSRLVKEKRIDFLIRSYAKLTKEEQEKCNLVIIGDGPIAKELANLVNELGLQEKIIFMGLIDHTKVFEIVAACDIYIHASLRETQGLVLNEAAACGKPLIMIDKEVNPVLEENKNGFFAEDTTTDFSKKMSILLHNKKMRNEFGDASKIKAKDTSQQQVAKRLFSLYKNLI